MDCEKNSDHALANAFVDQISPVRKRKTSPQDWNCFKNNIVNAQVSCVISTH